MLPINDFYPQKTILAWSKLEKQLRMLRILKHIKHLIYFLFKSMD